jgi:hypothetical protein
MENTMKKYMTALLVIFGMAAFIQANGTEEPANMKKSREEIEIMKGILNTTLSYAAQNLRQQEKQAASSKTNTAFTTRTIHDPITHAFRLTGQGVVFVIPTASLRASDLDTFYSGNSSAYGWENSISSSLGAISNQIWLTNEALETAPKASEDKDSSAQKREELRKKKAEELQAKVQKRREEEQAKKDKFLQNMAEIKSRMIETLANYGDSFTTIKPDEYINLVLSPDSGFTFEGEPSPYKAISIKRSWISDYKAGKLTLDSFKQKVLNYNE